MRLAGFALPILPTLLIAVPALAQTPPAPVTLSISFSDRALADMQQRGEGLQIGAYFSGAPAPAATLAANDIGSIDVWQETHVVPARPMTVVLGANLAAAPLDQVIETELLVNVTSAFWTTEENLLDCGLVQDVLARLAAPQTVLCKLIGE